jgi:hypothetical protein
VCTSGKAMTGTLDRAVDIPGLERLDDVVDAFGLDHQLW